MQMTPVPRPPDQDPAEALGLGTQRLALISGPFDADMTRIADLLNLRRIRAMILCQTDLPRRWLETYARQCSIAIVDSAHFPDPASLTRFLARLARTAPRLPVALLAEPGATTAGPCDLVLPRQMTQDALFQALDRAPDPPQSPILRRLG